MIKSYSELNSVEKKESLLQIQEIFFLSSSVQSFESEFAKEKFFQRWCGDYLEKFPESFFLFLDDQKRVRAYLSAHYDSSKSLTQLDIVSMQPFQDLFVEFPAHFHINTHPDSRSQGLGKVLVEHLLKICREKNLPGVHIITSPEQRNVAFYERAGFQFRVERPLKGKKSLLLFMGCRL